MYSIVNSENVNLYVENNIHNDELDNMFTAISYYIGYGAVSLVSTIVMVASYFLFL